MAIVDPPKPKVTHRSWLAFDSAPDDRQPIRWTSISPSSGEMTIKGLTSKEVEALEAFLNGTSYIRCVNGRLAAYSAFESLPDAEKDPLCGPHWRTDGVPKVYGDLLGETGWHMPGLCITALGASLGNDKRALENNQRLVEECGFECLRSKRSNSGKYWEQWVLVSLTLAKGKLGDFLQKHRSEDWKQQAELACKFIAIDLRINFGSLDITIQRWALCAPD